MRDLFPTNEDLIKALVKDGILKTPLLKEAFLAIDRKDFVRPEYKNEAYGNYPLPIGESQTISQPLTVAFLLELLQPKPGQKILDVGAGSGWTSALLAFIVGQKLNSKSEIRNSKQIPNPKSQNPKVIAIERIAAISKFGEDNVQKYSFIEKGIVRWVTGDGSKGFPEESPFDGILAGASARELPEAWKEQVRVGGRIVTPIGSSVWLFAKKSDGKWREEEYSGFAFVPLISDSEV